MSNATQEPPPPLPAKLEPGQRHPQQVRDMAQALYAQGVPPSIIGPQLGMNPRTVETWARRGGWRATRATMQGNLQRAANAVISGSLIAASKAVREGLADEIRDQVFALRSSSPAKASQLPTKDGKQGRTAVARALVDAASTLFGWQDEAKIGLIVPMVGAEVLDVDPAPAPDCVQDTPSPGMLPAPVETSTPQAPEAVELQEERPAPN